ncbi:MAG: dTDP-4-dehydrorhamnose reductase [Deltaproteobacteria bacterium]|nr:dTDP-4-dehydrorhamnose reductase [Deltaproteobacteria bacterium]
MKILITGADGQLAMEFQRYLEKADCYQATALNKEKLDISDLNAVSEAILHSKPDIVLNCAAYNQVDKAEDDCNAAFKVNAAGIKNLAFSCKKNDALLVHYSTDYVFDGTKEDFYTEDDVPNPINNYGKSKLAGERFLIEGTDNFLLFRVSWVFGHGKQNFLYKLTELARKDNKLKIVCDQVSVPTYTGDIVMITMLAIEKRIRGLYHLTNSGYASRYEVARYYFEKLKLCNLLLPVTSNHFPMTAKRPYFSAMSNTKISEAVHQRIPDWKDAIDRFVSGAQKRLNPETSSGHVLKV